MANEVCRDLCPQLSEYLDGTASQALCAEIERHVAGCDNCRIVLDTLRRTVALYRGLPQPELPEGFRERLYATLRLDDYAPPKA
jgi:anti-sigma factor RsiW